MQTIVNSGLPSIHSLPKKIYPVKVLQFGTGNFLRGFADWIIQQANDSLQLNMGVAMIQSISKDDTLQKQNGDYTVVIRGLVNGAFTSTSVRVSVIQHIINGHDQQHFLAEAHNPDLEIILSNTTESGIVFDSSDNSLAAPGRSFPARLTQLLYHRFKKYPDKFLGIVPCELIEKNGEILKTCILEYAAHWNCERSFIDYIHNRLHFCNTLVDRIVTGFPKNPEVFWEALGYTDHALTVCEPYHLWAIEAPAWVQEKLPLHKAGLNVIYTDNLEPYRIRKVRILNGIHTTMAPVGILAGIKTVREAVEHPIIGRYLRDALQEEILPYVPGRTDEISQYRDQVINRFLNPSIEHQLATITLNSFSKFKVRLVPSIKAHAQQHQQPPERIALTFASLLLLYGGAATRNSIELKDDPAVLEAMRNAWIKAGNEKEGISRLVNELLARKDWWGEDLNTITGLGERVSFYLTAIQEHGILKTLEDSETK